MKTITIPGDRFGVPPVMDLTIRPQKLVRDDRGTWALVSIRTAQKVHDHFHDGQYGSAAHKCPEIDWDWNGAAAILVEPKLED